MTNLISSLLVTLFENKHEYDSREPIILFTIPEKMNTLSRFFMDTTIKRNATKIGLLVPSLSFWLQLFYTLIIQTILSQVIGTIVYYFIIQNNNNSKYIIGYGIIIPITITLPFYLIQLLNVHNLGIMMGIAAIAILPTFRCLEAMYGYAPPHVKASFQNYKLYFSFPGELQFDFKTDLPVKTSSTSKDVQDLFGVFVLQFIILGLLYSILEPMEYLVFRGVTANVLFCTNFGEIANNFILALHTYLCLTVGTVGVCLVTQVVFAIKTINVTNNPILKSASPSDFWSKRWNLLIHGVLKRGIFKPCMKYFGSRGIATFASFLASSLLHEYLLFLIYYTLTLQNINKNNYYPIYGNQTLFFLWNGVLIFLEYMTGHWIIFKWMKQSLSTYVITMLVLMMSLPISHLFTDEYVNSGFYSHFKVGFPILVLME